MVYLHAAHVVAIVLTRASPYPLITGTASDDQTCRVFDLRADQEVAILALPEGEGAGATSVAFSRSGRMLFAGYESGVCHAWDVLTATKAGTFQHTDRVTSVGVSPDGTALATASWDLAIKVWAQ